ncbi:MAG: DUF6171 family protein [Clostridium sp.]|nr:DUF6171 family protein [Clostridium sp.]
MRTEEARPKRPCRKCLTSDMADPEGYFRSLREYLANLDADQTVRTRLYESRLDVCGSCELLLEGLCRACGCYVELRAAMRKHSCPWGKW